MPHSIVWLRNDFRLADNPALSAACAASPSVTAIFIDETDASLRPIGGAARAWRERSLALLGKRLGQIGVPLVVRRGEALSVLAGLIQETGATAIHWNRRYGPAERELDTIIKAQLSADGVSVHSHRGNVLAEPWEIATGSGGPYSVFTPFWKTLRTHEIERPLPAPEPIGEAIAYEHVSEAEASWVPGVLSHWDIGEEAAREKAADFLDGGLIGYAESRDFPSKESTSRLSPHLAFGEISARQLWAAARMVAEREPERVSEIDKFLSELAWRDFNHHQLYHRRDIARFAMREKYDGMAWRQADDQLRAWQRGQTGIPMVDAGMRQLWQTGFMENRVRMLTASLLAKNLLIDWRIGEAWFWDCLLDADAANNPGNWQWVAGSGLDAAPYFRIFNPATQGERFDGAGDYVRRWVPEVAELPDAWVHKPWEAPKSVLAQAGIVLGVSYPQPIVDLKASRQRALEASKSLGG